MSTTTTSTIPAPPAAIPAAAFARHAPGALRANVAALLATAPGDAFTVTQVARALSASGGAVGNALMSLAASGYATQTTDNPRTFTANAQTATAAVGAAVSVAPVVRAPKPRPSAAVLTPASALVTAPAAPPVPVDPAAPVARPNGTLYRPRALAGLSDVSALHAARGLEAPVLLYGPPGTGKTSLIEAAFPDVVTVTADGDCAVSDFVGEWTQNADGTYSFVYGPLVEAMTSGRVLFVDDATLAAPKVLSCLYPAMDGRKAITVKAHKGETITAAPGFFVVAAHNPNVSGALLTEALSSRFALHVHVASDLAIADELGINRKAVRVAKNLATRAAKGEVTWSVQLRELLAFAKVERLLGTEAAFANLIGIAPEPDRDTVADVVASVTGVRAEALAIGGRLTPATANARP